jgi:hypothetical protein
MLSGLAILCTGVAGTDCDWSNGCRKAFLVFVTVVAGVSPSKSNGLQPALQSLREQAGWSAGGHSDLFGVYSRLQRRDPQLPGVSERFAG